MANTGWTQDPSTIIVPPSAGPSDPRIVIGDVDPLGINFDPAIYWFWGLDRAFFIAVDRDAVNDEGFLQLWGYDPVDGLHQYAEFKDSAFDGSKNASIGADLDFLALQSYDLRCIPLNDGSATPRTLQLADTAYAQPDAAHPMTDTIYYGRSAGRGEVGNSVTTADSAAITTTETVLLTIASQTYFNGRAYEVTTKGGLNPAANGCNFQMRVRKNNAAGAGLGEMFRTSCPFSGAVQAANFGVGAGAKFVVTNGDATAAIALTGQATAAGNVTHVSPTGTPREVRVWDIGSADDYQLYPVLNP